jgi:hypothetical protein
MTVRDGRKRTRQADQPRPNAIDRDSDVPRWAHPRVTPEDFETAAQRSTRQSAATRSARRSNPSRDGFLIGMAIAPGATSIVALVMSIIPQLSGTGDIPAGIVLVLIFQVAAIGLIQQTSLAPWTSSWIAVGFLTSVVLPMLALQMSLVHEPFVSLELGSAAPSILATLLLLALYIAFALWVGWVCQGTPERAAPLLMPATLAIPAMMGAHGSIDQQAALVILSEVTLLSALATAIAWLFPGWPQLLSGACAFAIELIRLWVSGRGPSVSETSGTIVGAIYILMLLVAVVTIVMVPVGDAMLEARRTFRRPPSRRRRAYT